MKKNLMLMTGAISFLLGMCTAPTARSQDRLNPATAARFDKVVRDDFFAGFKGDESALQRAMKVTEEVLRENPEHAEALVWAGAGVFAQAGIAFRSGDQQNGMELWNRSLAMMDRAVELAPDDAGVRIPRGATLMTASREVPPQMAGELVRRALSDYHKAWDLQKDSIGRLASHSKGELLMGLADLHDRAGNAGSSREFLLKVTAEMEGTLYAERAKKWMKGELPAKERTCIGCHDAGKQNSR